MEKRPKRIADAPRPQAVYSKPSPPQDPVPAAPTPTSLFLRAAAVAVALLLGGYLIETHRTAEQTLAGLALWAVAVFLSLGLFPKVPAAGIFSTQPAPKTIGRGDWNKWKITLTGAFALAALGASNYFLRQPRVGFLLFSLLILGWCLTLLEVHLPWGQGNKPQVAAPGPRFGFPWAALVILLSGAFFLFYKCGVYPVACDPDSLISLNLARDSITGIPTPYQYGWVVGNPLFPYWVLGLFFKVVGCSFQKGNLFIGILNLAGYLFFYGFARFYLSKFPALATTLLLIASHWLLDPTRKISGAWGMLIPLECAALYFFARALEKGKARDFAFFGVLITFMILSNLLGWGILFFFLMALAIFWVWRRPAIQNQKKSWALALFVAFLFYFPMFLYCCQKGNPYCFPIFWFKKDLYLGNGTKPFIPWDNIHFALQMFNINARHIWMDFFPLLSPWGGLFLLVGLGWCLWRFSKPASFFILLGLLTGLCPVFLNNEDHIRGAFPAAPFVFLLAGLGLDRLSMALAAPLGHRGRPLRFLLVGGFLALAVGWQYDIFFNHLPRFFGGSCWNYEWNGRRYLFGTTTAKYLEGWNTYVSLRDKTIQHPEDGYFYSKTDMGDGRRIVFGPELSSLPLKNLPQKGDLLLLPDPVGKAFQDWIGYYYPASREKEILNPFGDVEYRYWEITPDQIKKALASPPGPPPGGMTLSWFDARKQKLGQYQIPTLSAGFLNEEWYGPGEGTPPFPWKETSYFTVQGTLIKPVGNALVLETNGKVEGFIGSRKFLFDGRDSSKRFEIPLLSKNPEPFKIRYYLPKDRSFQLNLLEKTPLGWDMIPPSALKPQEEAK